MQPLRVRGYHGEEAPALRTGEVRVHRIALPLFRPIFLSGHIVGPEGSELDQSQGNLSVSASSSFESYRASVDGNEISLNFLPAGTYTLVAEPYGWNELARSNPIEVDGSENDVIKPIVIDITRSCCSEGWNRQKQRSIVTGIDAANPHKPSGDEIVMAVTIGVTNRVERISQATENGRVVDFGDRAIRIAGVGHSDHRYASDAACDHGMLHLIQMTDKFTKPIAVLIHLTDFLRTQ